MVSSPSASWKANSKKNMRIAISYFHLDFSVDLLHIEVKHVKEDFHLVFKQVENVGLWDM